MKEIQLTQGKVALVDDEDFERISIHKWQAFNSHKYRGGQYFIARHHATNGHIMMHRLIAGLNFKDKNLVVDHINHNTLDNRKSNLRVCTKADNSRNCILPKHNTSGFKGVWQDKRNGTWKACLSILGCNKHVGTFFTKEEAARAYDEAAKKHYGEFAYLNFPTGAENRVEGREPCRA